jgi:hypothetical protein
MMTTFDIAYRIAYTDTFTRDQRRFATDRQLLADLALTVAEISRQPFKNPQLETHRVKGAQPGVMTSYVGTRQHRVIWFRAGQTAVLLLFDRHDEAYRRASRLRVAFSGEEAIVVSEAAAPVEPSEHRPVAPAAVRGPFDPWDDALLADVGFAPHEINLLRDARSDDGLLGLQRYLSPQSFELALQVAVASSEDEVRALATAIHEPDEPSPDEEAFGAEVEERVRAGAEGTVAVARPEEFEAVLTKPIEDWMVFLHPDQRRLVDRRFAGPARITGGAGTGKTVVGIHRAARLVRAGRKVLFTTYIRTLPGVLETLYARLDPENAGRVTFAGVHSYAFGIVRTQSVRLEPQQAEAAFDEAWRRTAPRGSPLWELGLGKQYFRDEIAWIIKGRGLTNGDREKYLDSPRTGRGTPFPREIREQIWNLFLFYERRLRARNTIDFDDILRLARDRVREQGDPRYNAVIVDEAQDLTKVGLELMSAIAGDGEDGLLLLGDGQQSLYPGGHSLGSVGIDVRGRAAVLRLNYRNTREILSAANRVVAGRPFDDGDDEIITLDPNERIIVSRSGEHPAICGFDSVDDHDEAMLVSLEALAGRSDTDLGDIAVLVPTNSLARGYLARITGLGMAGQSLERYDGKPSSAVKVGTFKRAKGLEFKHVFVPRAEPTTLRDARLAGEDAATHQERLDRTRRELFVAITRARDTVWVGFVGVPSVLLGVDRSPT